MNVKKAVSGGGPATAGFSHGHEYSTSMSKVESHQSLKAFETSKYEKVVPGVHRAHVTTGVEAVWCKLHCVLNASTSQHDWIHT